MTNEPEKLIPGPDLIQCPICTRRFNSDRVKIHEAICQKSSGIRRKSFDSSQQRVKGSEIEKLRNAFQKTEVSEQMDRTPVLLTNWRWRQEDFRNKIKIAKEVCEKMRDTSPWSSGTTQCPHCLKKFNQASAERHVIICDKFMLQRRVLKLYKDFFQATREIENEISRKEVQEWIRHDFKKNKNEKNVQAIQLFIHHGERYLRELRTNINLSK